MGKLILQRNELIFRMILISFAIAVTLAIYLIFFLHGKVSVEVEPNNVIVTLDNKPTAVVGGSASFVTNLGRHTLKVEADDYVGFQEEISLSRGKNYSKKIILKKAPEPVEIASGADNVAVKGNDIYWRNTNDKLFYLAKISFSADGSPKVLPAQAITSAPIDNFNRIIWSPTKEMLMIKRGTDAYIFDFKKYDFVSQAEKLYSNYVGDIAWSPDNSRIAYYYAPPGGERSLIFADAANQNVFRAANLAQLGIYNPYLAFSPSSEWLVIIPRNMDYGQNQIYLMNVYTKEVVVTNNKGNQKEAVFSAESDKIIYSTYSDMGNNPVKRILSVVNIDGSNKKSLGIAARASDLRFFQDPDKVLLPQIGSGSKLVLVDINSGRESGFYFSGQGNSEVDDIHLSDDKTGVFFTSKGKLYFVKLEGSASL